MLNLLLFLVATFVDAIQFSACFESLHISILWIASNTSSPTHEPRPLLQTINRMVDHVRIA